MLCEVPVPPLNVVRFRAPPDWASWKIMTGADAVARVARVIAECGWPETSNLAALVSVNPVAVPLNAAWNQNPKLIPPARAGKLLSLTARNQELEPVFPCSPVCCHAAEPGWAVTGLPDWAEAGEDCGSPYSQPCCWATL